MAEKRTLAAETSELKSPSKKARVDDDEKKVASDDVVIPTFDISKYLEAVATGSAVDDELVSTCREIANTLHQYGILIVKDPRVTPEDNDNFLEMMEQYFEQDEKTKLVDARPEVFYQVGVTPNGVEHARNQCARIKELNESEKPITECPPGVDPKWRFFWRMGERPPQTQFAQMNPDPVVPAAFPHWTKVMDNWGTKMLSAVYSVAEMAAIGFGFEKDTFTKLLKYGPHLLAPTGSDLGGNWGKLGTVFAHFHYDLNFLTIHGRSRFPGLFVWTREGKKVMVRVPPNCLLLQAGKQFEWLTGGFVLAGFHEVVVVDATIKAIELARAQQKSLWRISSTLFSHVASDNILQPMEKFSSPEAIEKYPPTFAGKQVQDELNAIKLGVRPADE